MSKPVLSPAYEVRCKSRSISGLRLPLQAYNPISLTVVNFYLRLHGH
jgi:hypothetical protein